MTYAILGQNLYETADGARKFFSQMYGATHFSCEQVVEGDLPLKPTWQAKLATGYRLCVEVLEKPFTNSLYAFVTQCVARGLPVKLWVAVPKAAAGPSFNGELKAARDAGIGVVQISDPDTPHEFHRPVPLSLFGLKKTDFKRVPRGCRENLRVAENAFLDGSPSQGCQTVCQELEDVTRKVAEYTHSAGWWKQGAKGKGYRPRFFRTDSWAVMLEQWEQHADVGKIRQKCGSFSKQLIVRTRAHTEWRNAVSHKPRNLQQLKIRDARLRTMFESTRDLLVEWYDIAKPLKIVK
jgi:hypothetical protein